MITDHLKKAKWLANILDTKYKILGVRFGFDPLLDFIPALGSIIGALVSLYIFWIALKMEVPWRIYIKMLFNIFLDLVLGAIPVVGIFFDIYYKSNIKNIKLLEDITENGIIISN